MRVRRWPPRTAACAAISTTCDGPVGKSLAGAAGGCYLPRHDCGSHRQHPQFRDHRAYRPWQVDARRPADSAHRRARGARDGRAGARFDGHRARARHHDQGADRAAQIQGARRQGLHPQPDRHARPRRLRLRGQPQPRRLRRRAAGRRRVAGRRGADAGRTSTRRSTTISRSCRSSTRSTCRPPSPRRSSSRSRT